MRHDMRDGSVTPTDDTKAGKAFRSIADRDECPKCKHKGFYGGPSGGMSQNIFCKNVRCRQGWNVTAFFSDGIAEEIGRKELDWYADVEEPAVIEEVRLQEAEKVEGLR